MARADGVTRFSYPYVRTKQWQSGRVALLGDAAHALPPTLGQGAGLSVTNAKALVRLVDETGDVLTALPRWEHEFRWVTDATQNWARRYDALTAHWPRSLDAVRWGIIWSFGKIKPLNNRMRVADRVTVG